MRKRKTHPLFVCVLCGSIKQQEVFEAVIKCFLLCMTQSDLDSTLKFYITIKHIHVTANLCNKALSVMTEHLSHFAQCLNSSGIRSYAFHEMNESELKV